MLQELFHLQLYKSLILFSKTFKNSMNNHYIMLKVKTYLSMDSFKGIGLFAKEDIPKGKIVWVYDDITEKTYTKKEFKRLPAEFKEFLKEYAYFTGDKIILNIDNSRFFNHSNNPNTIELKNGIIKAKKLIKQNEELTCDYTKFDKNKGFCASFLKNK
jgi:uncharacterized protein